MTGYVGMIYEQSLLRNQNANRKTSQKCLEDLN